MFDTSYEYDYGKGIEDIFFNIWPKHHELDFKFLGKEFQTMMADWEDHEKRGALNTNPPPSSEESKEDCAIIQKEPITESPDQLAEATNDANNQAPNA